MEEDRGSSTAATTSTIFINDDNSTIDVMSFMLE
jgi:hypothetical protein